MFGRAFIGCRTKEGFEKSYDEHGNLENTRFYKDGLLEGVYVEYGENGVLAKEINFQKGEPVLGYIYDIYGNKTPMSQDELANVKITDWQEENISLILNFFKIKKGNLKW